MSPYIMKKGKVQNIKDYFDQNFSEEELEKHNASLVQSIFYFIKITKEPMN